MSFIVRISTGILVTGEEQRARKDLSWWTSKKSWNQISIIPITI